MLGWLRCHCVVVSVARGAGIIWHGLGRWSPSLTLWIVGQYLIKGTIVNLINTPKVGKYSHFFFQKEALSVETKGTLVGLHPPCFSSVRPNTPSKTSIHNSVFHARRAVHLGKERHEREMWQKQCGARAVSALGRCWNLLRNRMFGVQVAKRTEGGENYPLILSRRTMRSSRRKP